MADQTDTKTIETKAEVLPAAAPRAPVAEPAKTETVKAEPAKAAPAIKAPAVAKAAAPKAKAPVKAARKTRTAKPARKKPVQARKTRTVKPSVAKAATAAAIVKPARAGAKVIRTGVKTMNTQTRKTAETAQAATEQFTAVIGNVNERAKTAFEKSQRIAEELAELTRGNVEAIVASSKVAVKGVETLGQGAAEYSRKSFEEASAALKSFTEMKSATDFFKLQGEFARSAFDHAVAESARMSETVLKLAGDVAEPINSRYAVAAERVKTLAA